MKENILHIKNMVCDRCLMSIQSILNNQQLEYKSISLGRIELKDPLSQAQFQDLEHELNKMGFELLSERNDKIVTHIKSVIIALIYDRKDYGNKKLSKILSEEIHYDYSHLTNIFTKAEGQSIQGFQNKIKAARIKELLEYGELNIAEIADKMGFGSAAYLSTFFKKETGQSPSQYKLEPSKRNSLDGI